MDHRNGRRDKDWTPLLLMGLAALMSMFRGSGRRSRGSFFDNGRTGRRAASRPSSPIATLVMLVGAFLVLGGLLSLLSLIAALGNGGALLVVCGVPVALVAFMGWMFNQRVKQAQAPASQSQEGTIDAMPGEVRAVGPAEAESQAAAPTRTATAPVAARPPAGGHAEPVTRRAAKAAAALEKHPSTPAQYRQRAVSYRRKIQSLIKNRRPGPIAERMNGVLQRLKSWEERVGELADRLALYENDDLIQRDMRETPGHIARLQRQLSLETEPEMQQQVRRTMAAYEEQQRQLELLARVMKRTRLNLDDTLAAMGTVYSQLQVLNAMDIDGPTATRIADDVDREVERLNDLLAATSEVYAQSGETASQPATNLDDENAGQDGLKARLGGNASS